MHPDRLAAQLQYLEQNPSIDLVDNWSYLIDMEGRVVGLRRLPEPNITLRDVVRGPVILNGSSLGRMQMYRDNPFDPTLRRAEDWEMWIRAFQNHRFGRIHEPLYFRRCIRSEGGRTFELKEFRNLAYVRRILLRHGPRLIGWRQTLLAMGEFHARFVVRTVLSLLRLQRLRPQSKQINMTDHEIAQAEEILKRILNVRVPGLEPL